MPVDIFESGFTLPREVTILASGPNGRPYWNQLEGYIISVNKAVMFHMSDLWLCWATAYWRWQDREAAIWWNDALGIDVLRAFGSHRDGGLAEKIECDYTFRYGQYWQDAPYGFKDGVLCAGGTISMAALQLCALLGVKRITLCGCDFHGCYYADGTISHHHGTYVPNHLKNERDWEDLLTANEIVAACKHRGMEIESISPTSLQI